MDPDYRCRFPRLDRYFRQVFARDVDDPAHCEAVNYIWVPSTSSRLSLNPNFIADIYLVKAAPGAGPASHLGHLMFAVVACPEGPDSFAACRQRRDRLFYFSFNGLVPDGRISFRAGVTGAYEMRPLVLTSTEADLRYRFLTVNCVSEALRLIDQTQMRAPHGAWGELTPDGVLKALQREGRVEPVPRWTLLSREQVLRGEFQRWAPGLPSAALSPPGGTDARREWWRGQDLPSYSSDYKQKILILLVGYEELAILRIGAALWKHQLMAAGASASDVSGPISGDPLDKYFKGFQLTGGYGIPLVSEIKELPLAEGATAGGEALNPTQKEEFERLLRNPPEALRAEVARLQRAREALASYQDELYRSLPAESLIWLKRLAPPGSAR